MNKYYLLGLFLIATGAFSQSPLDRGIYSLSGRISASSQTEDYSSEVSGVTYDGSRISNNYSVNPRLSCFILRKLSVGLSLSYSSTSTEFNADEDDAYTSKSSIIGYGPFVQYYLFDSDIKPFLGLEYSFRVNEDNNQGFDSKQEMTGYILSVGADYFLSRNVALTATLSRSSYDRQLEVTSINYSNSNQTTISQILSFGIGISTYIY